MEVDWTVAQLGQFDSKAELGQGLFTKPWYTEHIVFGSECLALLER